MPPYLQRSHTIPLLWCRQEGLIFFPFTLNFSAPSAGEWHSQGLGTVPWKHIATCQAVIFVHVLLHEDTSSQELRLDFGHWLSKFSGPVLMLNIFSWIRNLVIIWSGINLRPTNLPHAFQKPAGWPGLDPNCHWQHMMLQEQRLPLVSVSVPETAPSAPGMPWIFCKTYQEF